MDIIKFNKKYGEDISNDKTSYKFDNIGDLGLKIFCTFNLINLEIINLSFNTISNIDCFENMELPKLTNLNLSHNKIKNIEVFAKVNYPLEQLDLKNNEINNIDIFTKEKTLPKLNRLFLKNNDIDFEDKKIKEILDKIKKRMKNNEEKNMDPKNEEESLECKNDEDYSNLLKKLKTINSKIGGNIGIYDKDAISRIKTIKDSDCQNNEELNKIIDQISLLSSIREKN
jgi:hypothetical protein